MARIKRRIHQRTEEEIVELGYRGSFLQSEHGLTLRACSARFGASDNAVRRWVAKYNASVESGEC